MMISPKYICLLLATFFTISHSSSLSTRYQFNVTLVPDNYWLYWNFSRTTEVIQFAVRVKTTGWIGFGISPNGQMPGSDVVIGWMDETTTHFNDRYAFSRETPSIDTKQNWILTNSDQADGYTTLEFYRNFITCDDQDLNIQYETARIICSWNPDKPVLNSDGTYSFKTHTNVGSKHVNLLGGFPEPPQIHENSGSFVVGVDEVNVPDVETTYWCGAIKLPSNVIEQEKYIVKFSPQITVGSEPHVHHMLLYTCTGLEEADVGTGGNCFDGSVSSRITACTTQSVLLAAWSVGGSDFIYPDNVAYPIGGPGNPQYVVIEIHYNNPNLLSNIVDSSGLVFTYESVPRQHNAGVMIIGHEIDYKMVIPPKAHNFTVTTVCSDSCTKQNFPPDGIHVFGNMLHTHYTGIGLSLRRVQRTSCDGTSHYEELAPIEENLHYDFNFQQTNHLPQEVTILPGEMLMLYCHYNTTGRSRVTLGGLSTLEEMCFSVLVYYPKQENEFCLSSPLYNKYEEFITNYVPQEHQATFRNMRPERASKEQFENTFNLLEWTDTQIVAFQQLTYSNASHNIYCPTGYTNSTPVISCSYETTDSCTGKAPLPCCQRLSDRSIVSSSCSVQYSVALLVVAVFLVFSFYY